MRDGHATAPPDLLPVTIGNEIGGTGVVGLVCWFVYLRPRAAAPDPDRR